MELNLKNMFNEKEMEEISLFKKAFMVDFIDAIAGYRKSDGSRYSNVDILKARFFLSNPQKMNEIITEEYAKFRVAIP